MRLRHRPAHVLGAVIAASSLFLVSHLLFGPGLRPPRRRETAAQCRANIYIVLWRVKYHVERYRVSRHVLVASGLRRITVYHTDAAPTTPDEWDELRVELAPFLARAAETQVVAVGDGALLKVALAAMMGRPSLAVDSLLSRVRVLRFNMHVNRFDHLVWTLWNALGDRCPAQPRISAHKEPSEADSAPITRLDALTTFVRTRRLLLALGRDVGFRSALSGAARLFRDFDVRAVTLDWAPAFPKLHGEETLWVVEFLTSRGFQPFPSLHSARALSRGEMAQWPAHVAWRREEAK